MGIVVVVKYKIIEKLFFTVYTVYTVYNRNETGIKPAKTMHYDKTNHKRERLHIERFRS